jgi:hypothetical protein
LERLKSPRLQKNNIPYLPPPGQYNNHSSSLASNTNQNIQQSSALSSDSKRYVNQYEAQPNNAKNSATSSDYRAPSSAVINHNTSLAPPSSLIKNDPNVNYNNNNVPISFRPSYVKTNTVASTSRPSTNYNSTKNEQTPQSAPSTVQYQGPPSSTSSTSAAQSSTDYRTLPSYPYQPSRTMGPPPTSSIANHNESPQQPHSAVSNNQSYQSRYGAVTGTFRTNSMHTNAPNQPPQTRKY